MVNLIRLLLKLMFYHLILFGLKGKNDHLALKDCAVESIKAGSETLVISDAWRQIWNFRLRHLDSLF